MTRATLLLGALLIGTSASAYAAAPPKPPSASVFPAAPQAPAIALVPPPPPMFNAITASPEARARFGVPPAPEPRNAPRAYAEWLRAAAAPKIYPTAMTATARNLAHGPNMRVGAQPRTAALANAVNRTNGIVTSASSNWSGMSVLGGRFAAQEAIMGKFVVPTAQQAFFSCNRGWDYLAAWVGLDGNGGSNDVVQAGIDADAACAGTAKATFYTAWIEWYPNVETAVSWPEVNPGDVLSVQVWTVTPTSAYAAFHNFSNNQSATYHMTAPPGIRMRGSSVEWVVERPAIDGKNTTLTNYSNLTFPYGVAWNYAATSPTYYYAGAVPSSGIAENLVMLDDNFHPISQGYVKGEGFLYFENYGSSLICLRCD